MTENYLELTIGAIFVYNFVLTRFLGICPFLGVSKKIETAMGMAGAVVFVMTLASFCTSCIYHFLLHNPALKAKGIDLGFLQLIIFILIIAGLVQVVEIILQKLSPKLYSALGIYLPLITTNCAVLGVATINANVGRGIFPSTVFAFFSGLGFGLALLMFASLREKLDLAEVPKPFQGMAIALITAGILAMAFMGFAGLC